MAKGLPTVGLTPLAENPNEVIKRALIEYLKVHGREDLMRSAFERVVEQHRIALDKLEDL